MRLLSIIVLAFFTGPSLYFPSDAKSSITFQIRNFGLLVEGSLSGLDGEIVFDSEKPENCRVNLSVSTKTITTGIALRDNHLKKREYLDANTYPVISFKSEKIVKHNENWIATGKFTIKKTTKEVSFPFKVMIQDNGLVFGGVFKINRKDFDVGGNSLSMANELTITFKIVGVAR